MRRTGIIKIISLTLLCMALTASCAPKDIPAPDGSPEPKVYVPGSWEGGVFTSPFFGFSLYLPDGASVRSDCSSLLEGTDISMLGPDTDIFSGGTWCETVINDSSGRACAVMLVTDSLASTGVYLNSEDYASLMIRDMGASPEPALSREVLAGIDYVVFRYPEGSEVYNTYLVGEKDGVTVVWILSSHGRQRPSPEEMIRSMNALDPPEEDPQEPSGTAGPQ